MFRGRKQNGETITFFTPQSKMHPQGFYWVDITEEQAHVLSETDKALVVLRLKSRNILMVKWEVLKSYLTQECKRYNANEYNHWKLNICTDHIKISGNNREIPAKVWHFNAEV